MDKVLFHEIEVVGEYLQISCSYMSFVDRSRSLS